MPAGYTALERRGSHAYASVDVAHNYDRLSPHSPYDQPVPVDQRDDYIDQAALDVENRAIAEYAAAKADAEVKYVDMPASGAAAADKCVY